MAYAEGSNRLFSADENGTLVCWDMTAKRLETPEWKTSDNCELCDAPFFWNIRAMWDRKVSKFCMISMTVVFGYGYASSQISGECICLRFIFYAAFLDRYASFATPTFVCFSARAKEKGGEFLQISVTVSLFVPICIVLNVSCYYLLVGNPTLCCVKVSNCCISDRSSSDHVKKLNYSKVVKCNCRSYKCNRLWY